MPMKKGLAQKSRRCSEKKKKPLQANAVAAGVLKAGALYAATAAAAAALLTRCGSFSLIRADLPLRSRR